MTEVVSRGTQPETLADELALNVPGPEVEQELLRIIQKREVWTIKNLARLILLYLGAAGVLLGVITLGFKVLVVISTWVD